MFSAVICSSAHALFDLARREERASWPAHRADLNGIAFSPDGRYLASVSNDGSAKVWEVATRRMVAMDFDRGARAMPTHSLRCKNRGRDAALR